MTFAASPSSHGLDREAFTLPKGALTMCTRANRASVPDSVHALVGSVLGLLTAVAALTVAVVTVPLRLLQTRSTAFTRYGQPASTSHVQVQVHLEDGERVRAIQRSCRSALKRAARTWAPFPLPVDRV